MICSKKFIAFCSVFIVILFINGYLLNAIFGTDELAKNTKFQESSNNLVHLDQLNYQNRPLNGSVYKPSRELSTLNNNGTYEINKTSNTKNPKKHKSHVGDPKSLCKARAK